jgi:hypothetical protein
MKQSIQQRLTDPELVAARRAWEKRLDDFAGMPVYLQGLARGGTADMYHSPEQRLAEALEQLAEHVELLRDGSVFRPLSIRAALHGVHFVDKIFGAEVFELDGEKDNWQGKYLSSPVGTLKRPDLDTNPTWTAAREFARSFVASGVTVPAFQLPTIASALNIGLNLYGQDILMAMMTDPPAAHRDLAVINSVLLEIHDWYRATVPSDILQQVACSGRWQPPGCGQICGCSTQLVSTDHYAEFIAPHDDAILSRYPHSGMIHLCGGHTQHIPLWKKMKSLRAIQVNDRAAEDLEIYLREMPEKIYYVHTCEGMPVERVEKLAKMHKIVICAEPPQRHR